MISACHLPEHRKKKEAKTGPGESTSKNEEESKFLDFFLPWSIVAGHKKNERGERGKKKNLSFFFLRPLLFAPVGGVRRFFSLLCTP